MHHHWTLKVVTINLLWKRHHSIAEKSLARIAYVFYPDLVSFECHPHKCPNSQNDKRIYLRDRRFWLETRWSHVVDCAALEHYIWRNWSTIHTCAKLFWEHLSIHLDPLPSWHLLTGENNENRSMQMTNWLFRHKLQEQVIDLISMACTLQLLNFIRIKALQQELLKNVYLHIIRK